MMTRIPDNYTVSINHLAKNGKRFVVYFLKEVIGHYPDEYQAINFAKQHDIKTRGGNTNG